MTRGLAICVFAALCLTFPARAMAAPIVLDFDSLAEFDSVTTQFPGVTFTDATVLTAGSSLNEIEFPPHSGSNVVVDDGGPISIAFSDPIGAFGGYFTYAAPLTLSAFDADNNLITSILSSYVANLAESGDVGSVPNEFLQVAALSSGIASVTIAGDPLGGSFVLDDATLTALEEPAPVPEPSTVILVLTGCVALGWRRLRICG